MRGTDPTSEQISSKKGNNSTLNEPKIDADNEHRIATFWTRLLFAAVFGLILWLGLVSALLGLEGISLLLGGITIVLTVSTRRLLPLSNS